MKEFFIGLCIVGFAFGGLDVMVFNGTIFVNALLGG